MSAARSLDDAELSPRDDELVLSAMATRQALGDTRKEIRLDAIWIAGAGAVIGGLVAWVIALTVH